MPKLKVLAVVRHIIRLLADIPFLYRATGLWYVAILATQILVALLAPRTPPTAFPAAAFATMLLNGATTALALAACAVNVHRFVLLNEPPAALRVGRTEWRHILRGLWICLPFILVGAAVTAAVGMGFASGKLQQWGITPSPPIIALLYGAFGVGTMFFLVQLSLSLPAAAIGHMGFTASRGLDASNGNSMRLFLLASIVVIFWVAAQALLVGAQFFFRGLPTVITVAVALPLGAAILIAQIIAWAALLSFAYAGLVERRPDFLSLAALPSAP